MTDVEPDAGPGRVKDPIRVTTLTRRWRDLVRWLTPSEWAIWLLGLKRFEGDPVEPGLILIQIDGLSQSQFQRAVESGRMPFLASLLKRENYQQHAFYSGLPSSNPAVQGELHYGVKTAVPAFRFRDHQTGQLVRTFGGETAVDVERELKQSGPGLLEGGSSYCNVYGGGASDVHFCATEFGWSEFFSTINPLSWLLVLVLNAWMFFRVAGLLLVELVLAITGFLQGVIQGQRFWQELIMIPSRVIVVVLLRELATTFSCFDAARGVPVMHLNLLGYDEQAHRRGPESDFAHRTLPGIDRAVRKIWNAAHRGAGREYDVWVFSGRGQQAARPFQNDQNQTIQNVVAQFVAEHTEGQGEVDGELERPTRMPTRASWLGIGWLVSAWFGERDLDRQTRSGGVQTSTSGSCAFVYLLSESASELRDQLADYLVQERGVPMVVLREPEAGTAMVVTREGSLRLPGDVVQIFGAGYPFVSQVGDDLVAMANHDDAGDLLLIGWDPTGPAISFSTQNGTHGGPGTEEVSGFALLPRGTALPRDRDWIRPRDLRTAALQFLQRPAEAADHVARFGPSPRRGQLTLLTYNVHGCVGMDGQLSPERIARVIAQSGADVVCLQEVDVGRDRSGNRDQAHAIAEYLEMSHRFHPAWQVNEEQFGNAVLSRLPMQLVKATGLHHHKADRSRRSALWVELDTGLASKIQLINTHLSIYPLEQRTQAAELVDDWVRPAAESGPVVVCGDFNARPKSRTWKTLGTALRDVESFDARPTRSTYFSPFPMSRLDHMFVSAGIEVVDTRVIDSRIARVASDHLPLLAELEVRI